MTLQATASDHALDDASVCRRRIPTALWIVAVLAAMAHLAPHWRAQLQTPADWTYTGNLNGSPDVMQYRVWTRLSQSTGPLVPNTFTTEPNRPHLPVFFYYFVGKTSQWLHMSAEFLMAYMGAALAFIFTIIIFLTVRRFLPTPHQTWWLFGVILLGGGLGAHLKLWTELGWGEQLFVVKRMVFDATQSWPLFEDYRSHYVCATLFDTHFLLIWIVMMLSILSIYATVLRVTVGRVACTAVCCGVMTLLHVYEGVTLIMISAGIALVFWCRKSRRASSLVALATCAASVGVCIGWIGALYDGSSLALPPWRADNILVATLLIAYPVAWAVIAWGGADFWRRGGDDCCFLVGWALGCVVLTLSGPFYPYPDRGTMTLQIPLYLIAGLVYFARRRRVGAVAAVTTVLVLGATPAFVCFVQWRGSTFSEDSPHVFMSAEHATIMDSLRQRATSDHVLLVNKSDDEWKTDDLWLAPVFPGSLFGGHFFLSENYESKRAEISWFYRSRDVEQQAEFLQRRGISFVYVNARTDPVAFARIPGVKLVSATSVGSLFEFSGRQKRVYEDDDGAEDG